MTGRSKLGSQAFLILSVTLCAAAMLPKTLSAAPPQGEEKQAKAISSEDFLSSPAAEYFQAEQYEKALEALDSLSNQYPQDPLLLRYRAMALDRLGRSKEAISIFEDLLKQDPTHVPTRYFLGQAYERIGDNDAARKEWQLVAYQGTDTPYGNWAGTTLERIGPAPVRVKPSVKRWSIATRYGWEYDSNVVLKPNDDGLATTQDEGAGRHIMELRSKYRTFSRRDFAIDLFYDFRQSLHDNSRNEFNFTNQNVGLEVRKRHQVFNQDVIYGLRYEFSPGFLDGNLFSLKNQWTLNADFRFTPRTRTVFFDRMAATNFGRDGSDPPRTSRDGFYHDLGVTHYWYSQDFRRYLFLQEEFNSAFTRGGNFDQLGNTTRVGVHIPLVKQTDLDLSGGLETGFYRNFSSLSSLDLSRRRDINWDLYAAVTHHLTSNLSLRGFYRFTNATNQNNFFDYDRHVGGAQIIYTL